MISEKFKIEVISQTIDFVKRTSFSEKNPGHGWWHVNRVYNMAKFIGAKENADIFVIKLSALLHDIDDWKFNETESAKAEKWLKNVKLGVITTEKVLDTIKQVSFKGAGENTVPNTIEAKVVQDADRLDAIGAIGIARAFAYGGFKNRSIYEPEVKPHFHATFNEYKNIKSHTINHFYEKLLLLKNLMNTQTAKKIANDRHKFLQKFLSEFYKEWDFSITDSED